MKTEWNKFSANSISREKDRTFAAAVELISRGESNRVVATEWVPVWYKSDDLIQHRGHGKMLFMPCIALNLHWHPILDVSPSVPMLSSASTLTLTRTNWILNMNECLLVHGKWLILPINVTRNAKLNRKMLFYWLCKWPTTGHSRILSANVRSHLLASNCFKQNTGIIGHS